MERPLSPQNALVLTMVLVSAATGDMSDEELGMMGRIVRQLPVFKDFDIDSLPEVGRQGAKMLREDEGLDSAMEAIAEALPTRLRETAYALACDVAAADSKLDQEELHLLEIIRHSLGIDRLNAAAIERGTRARFQTL
ncbi:MAG: tellurite resistance TerB family protein [Geminicoccaceae bacterium]